VKGILVIPVLSHSSAISDRSHLRCVGWGHHQAVNLTRSSYVFSLKSLLGLFLTLPWKPFNHTPSIHPWPHNPSLQNHFLQRPFLKSKLCECVSLHWNYVDRLPGPRAHNFTMVSVMGALSTWWKLDKYLLNEWVNQISLQLN
jgi:hypothetical protein